jgi:uncharacterized protein (DUF1499 family)
MRRLILDEPYSQTALWSRRLATFAIAVAAISVVLSRARAVEMTAGLAVFGAAILIACVAVLLALTAGVVIWRTGRRGGSIAFAGLVLAVMLLAYPAWLTVKAVQLPVVNDVSTDLVDPPNFSLSAKAQAARSGYTPRSLTGGWSEKQRHDYPDIQPIVLDLEADDAYQLVLKAVAVRGWQIIDQMPPGGRIGLGHIDAISRSLVMGFPDDITIRIRPLAGQTRIDVRSASRYGRHDFGSNARHISDFSDELQTQLDAR